VGITVWPRKQRRKIGTSVLIWDATTIHAHRIPVRCSLCRRVNMLVCSFMLVLIIMRMYMCVYVCVCACVCVCMCVSIYMCVCECVHACRDNVYAEKCTTRLLRV
jgi:hypothetical protein